MKWGLLIISFATSGLGFAIDLAIFNGAAFLFTIIGFFIPSVIIIGDLYDHHKKTKEDLTPKE